MTAITIDLPAYGSTDRVKHVLVVAILVGALAYGGMTLASWAGKIATIWPANGLLLGILLTAPRERRLEYFVAGILAGAVASYPIFGSSLISLRVTLINGSEVATAC